MRSRSAVCLLLVAALAPSLPARETAGDREKPRRGAVRVTVDTTEVPDLAGWGRKARELVEKWHPRIAELLNSAGFTPPGEVRIVFKKDMRGVAYTMGNTIVIAADWVRKHPDDYGMVVHELTHVIQAYRGGRRPRPSWLVEGIADYVRFYHYEPRTVLTLNPRRASYRDGYRTTAMFLAWVARTHDRDAVRQLNEALRQGAYRDEWFRDRTGKTLDELWAAFLASVERRKGAGR